MGIPIMSIVDGVVSSADAHLIHDCAFAQIPLFALHHVKDTEQMLNVKLLKRQKSISSTNSNASSIFSRNDIKNYHVPNFLFGSSFESLSFLMKNGKYINYSNKKKRIREDMTL